MKYLYVDNFRGFTKTFIPIDNVNFMVGENSTGKSSILGLLKLISSNEFWFSNDSFDIGEVNLGNFSDMVSVNSADKSHFSIGVYVDETTRNKKRSNQVHAFLISYAEREGIPEPTFMAYQLDNEESYLRIGPSRVKYKKNKDIKELNSEELQKKFSRWSEAFLNDSSGYKLLPKELSKMPLGFLITFAETALNSKNNSKLPPIVHGPLREDITWLAPIRTKPRRTYDEYKLDFSPEGDHTPYLIKKMLSKKAEGKRFKAFIEEIGKDSGLFDSISITNYGRSVTAPFELDVILNGKELSVHNVGYGVSQALPIIVELFVQDKSSSYALQQPEVHLHPRAQAAIGDVIYTLAKNESKKFLIETHSDFLIDRFRYRYRNNNENPNSQILFFERTNTGNKVTSIKINSDGELSDKQPDSYRAFFIREELKSLGLD